MKASSLLLCLALVSSLTAAEPAQLELAHRAVQASQFEQGLEQLRGQIMMSSLQKLGVSSPLPEAQDEATKATLAKITAAVDEQFKTIIGKLDAVYADVYTEKELTALTAFYESAEGKSFLGKQPTFAQHFGPVMQTLRVELNMKLSTIINEAKAALPAPAAAPGLPAPTLAPASPATATPPPVPAPAK